MSLLQFTRPTLCRRVVSVLAAFVAIFAAPGIAHATTGMTFSGTFTTGITPWSQSGGGAQCANYGTVSKNQRLRGNLYFTSMNGVPAGQFSLQTNPSPSTWPLQACDLNSGVHNLVLPADQYIGLAVYIPVGFSIPNKTGYTNIGEFHMQDVGGQPPFALFLHNGNVQIIAALGAWSSSCHFQYSYPKNLPLMYAIPQGHLAAGTWNSIVLHIHWASDSTGQMQSYYRAANGAWQTGSSLSGIPTISWNAPSSFVKSYADNVGNYTTAVNAPFSLYLTDEYVGSSLSSVQSMMP